MSATNTKAMVNNIKAEGQDFEWYPTTKEMVEKLYDVFRKKAIGYNKHIRSLDSVLDIGAGDGRVLEYFNEICVIISSARQISKQGQSNEKS